MDGPEIYQPEEGGEGGTGNVSEGVSEQAREQFAQAQAAVQQIRREEKKAKKRDDGVAQMILQFLSDTQRTHLATLISRLVSINCPSPFILSILSLINDGCRSAVDDYLQERRLAIDTSANTSMTLHGGLSEDANKLLMEWIMRMQMILSLDTENILTEILVDDTNIDGTVLQLATFVFQQFLDEHGKNAQFESVQQLAINILQTVFELPMRERIERQLQAASEATEIEE